MISSQIQSHERDAARTNRLVNQIAAGEAKAKGTTQLVVDARDPHFPDLGF
jgi:hypothetical protein